MLSDFLNTCCRILSYPYLGGKWNNITCLALVSLNIPFFRIHFWQSSQILSSDSCLMKNFINITTIVNTDFLYILDCRVAFVKQFYQQKLLVGFNPTGDWFSPHFLQTPISYLFRTLKEKSYTVDYNMLYLNTFHLSLMEYVQSVSTEIWECLFFYLIHKLYP